MQDEVLGHMELPRVPVTGVCEFEFLLSIWYCTRALEHSVSKSHKVLCLYGNLDRVAMQVSSEVCSRVVEAHHASLYII